MENQFYVGVDVGKYRHQATLISHNGARIGQSFAFANSLSDFEFFRETIKKQLPDDAVVKIAMEATGHYYWHLRDYLVERGFNVEVINPIETQAKAKTRIRKVKNDRIDSLIIAEIASQKDCQPLAGNSSEFKQLRELTRFEDKLKSQARFYKQEISTLLERLCPEFFSYFSNIFLGSSRMIIQKYFLEQGSRDHGGLIKEIVQFSRQRIDEAKAKKILLILDNSLGLGYRSENSRLQLTMLFQSLELVERQIKEIAKKIAKAGDQFQEIEYLSSIKGVSRRLASVILSEIGDINRFTQKEQLTAFAGLDPSVKQSGRYSRKQGNHISKRGSKYLRKQLYYAAKTAIIFDPELKAYYQRKRAQGKHYNVVVIAVARKILMRVYAILKQKRPYELRVIS